MKEALARGFLAEAEYPAGMQIYEDRNTCSHIYRQEVIPLILGRLPAHLALMQAVLARLPVQPGDLVIHNVALENFRADWISWTRLPMTTAGKLLPPGALWAVDDRPLPHKLEQAAAQLKGRALLVKVNSDDNPLTSSRFGIRSLPTLVKLDHGREISRRSGALPAGQIVAFAG
jgi:hypothetical protein